MARLFGTDGVRGVANAELTAELALDLAVAAAHVLVEHRDAGRRPVAVVGRDTRASGEFLEAAVVAGLASAGVDVHRVGVVPTPAVAHLTPALSADLGVVLSASHNPMPDNGIKLVDRNGFKLPDAVEDEIEARVGEAWRRPVGAAVGRVLDATPAVEAYLAHLLEAVPQPLHGLRVVVDCAHGAAAGLAPDVLTRAGARVSAIGAAPDGLNINDEVGCTHPQALQAEVLAQGADVGIAFDGDADRCLAVDATGALVDGDRILAICALTLRERDRLPGPGLVATVMSNLGFLRAMAAAGIDVVQAQVGDRYVLEEMQARGLVLGGEQSGHVVFLDEATTGDGMLTALHVLARMAATGRTLADLASVVRSYPQVLVNVPVGDKAAVMASPSLAEAVGRARAQLGTQGRVLLRPSGTESLVRVMVEAGTDADAYQVADRLAALVRAC